MVFIGAKCANCHHLLFSRPY